MTCCFIKMTIRKLNAHAHAHAHLRCAPHGAVAAVAFTPPPIPSGMSESQAYASPTYVDIFSRLSIPSTILSIDAWK